MEILAVIIIVCLVILIIKINEIQKHARFQAREQARKRLDELNAEIESLQKINEGYSGYEEGMDPSMQNPETGEWKWPQSPPPSRPS